jgi:hypothetical protein
LYRYGFENNVAVRCAAATKRYKRSLPQLTTLLFIRRS